MPLLRWNWWIATDAGLLTRIGIGVAIFTVLAAVDLRRHGRSARRWREYVFLLIIVLAAIVYGIVNDNIAVSISPEYFVYGKGVDAAGSVRWGACKIGMKASFSAGLIIGVAMLLANNPRKQLAQLPYRKLLAMLLEVFACAAISAAIGAGLGAIGALNGMSSDLQAIWRQDLFRSRHFLAVFGMNLGGYTGAVVGTAIVIGQIVRRRTHSAIPAAGASMIHA